MLTTIPSKVARFLIGKVPISSPSNLNNIYIYIGGIRANAFISGGYVPQNLRGTKSEDCISVLHQSLSKAM